MSWAGLYTAISGLEVQRTSLQTISHNISNSGDRNYVRQSALHANDFYTTGVPINQKVGRGVKISEIRQIRDEFLDIRYRHETAPYSFYKAKEEVLEDVEAVFREKSTEGILGVMETFWSHANELVKNPSSLTIRGLMHESGVAVCNTFNSLSKQLDNAKRNLNQRIYDQIDRANAILEEIAKCNTKIRGLENANEKYSMNDVRDRRNSLIDELSAIIPVEAIKSYDGEMMIYTEGRMMVSGDYVNHIVPKTDRYGYFHPAFEDNMQEMSLRGYGSIGGLLEVRDRSIPEYELRLDNYARTFATKVNEIHRKAHGLPTDAIPKGSTGNSFFISKHKEMDKTVYNSAEGDHYIDAASITMNPDLANLNNIATSYSGLIEDAAGFQDIIKIRMTMEKSDKPYIKRDLEKVWADQYFVDGLTEYNPKTQRYEGITKEELSDKRQAEIAQYIKDNSTAQQTAYDNAKQAYEDVLAKFNANPPTATKAEVDTAKAALDNASKALTEKTIKLREEKLAEIREPIYKEYNDKLKELANDPENHVSVDDYYRDMIFAVGVERETAIVNSKAQRELMDAIDDKRRQISGVSLDEEMTNVIQFQHAYTANTRVVNVIDEMLEQIVNRTGIVGR